MRLNENKMLKRQNVQKNTVQSLLYARFARRNP